MASALISKIHKNPWGSFTTGTAKLPPRRLILLFLGAGAGVVRVPAPNPPRLIPMVPGVKDHIAFRIVDAKPREPGPPGESSWAKL